MRIKERKCIRIDIDYPGFEIDHGWKTLMKYELDPKSNEYINYTRLVVSWSSTNRNWMDATIKLVTLLGKLQDKIRVDIFRNSRNYQESIKTLCAILDHIISIQYKVIDILSEASDNLSKFDFINAYNELESFNNQLIRNLNQSTEFTFKIYMEKFNLEEVV